MFIVTYRSGTQTWFLRSTIWSAHRDRATVFASQDAASGAIRKALMFMKGKSHCLKDIAVVEVEAA